MLETVREMLVNACLVKPGDRVVVGVSGGPDSLCLLHLLHHSGIRVVAAHLNHQLRPEAESEAAHVQEVAQALGVDFILGEEDVRRYAEAHGKSLEEAARERRYDFLYRVAGEQRVQAVAVGHNADDQVETVLMHLLRGSGLSGLRGMRPRTVDTGWGREIPLIRPLLSIWREQIVDYCRENQLAPVFDKSNLDATFYRNRLRHELIPNLETYNPQVKRLLWQMADTLAGDDDVLERGVDESWLECLADRGNGWVALWREQLASLQIGEQRRIWRRAIACLRPGLRDIDYAAIRRAVAFVRNPSQSKQIDLVAGLRLLMEGDRVWLAGWEADLPILDWPQVEPGATLTLAVPGEVELQGGWTLRAEWEAMDAVVDEFTARNDPYQVWIDGQNLVVPLVVRGRVPGDRFSPLGMDGHSIKLSDFFINAKLPQRARSGWPLVCSGEAIAWIPGHRISHQFRIQAKTEKLISLRLVKKGA